jgi:class 3 adenylate cyclase
LIVSRGDEGILETHRRDIVVVFCDLRGFTAFAETAELDHAGPSAHCAPVHNRRTALLPGARARNGGSTTRTSGSG